ncbi:MAG: acetate--CoA ligase family protein [Nitrospirae bacterium]|nr:acetate--CoA ligase family protein [Nitrospirota bacterium]
MNPLDTLFNPESIILVGAAHTEDKLGGIILRNLLKFKGKVSPVNPQYGKLMGLQAYPSVSDIPGPVDLAIIVRPAQEVPEILEECKGRAGYAIVVSSGFAEAGREDLQDEVKRIGLEAGVRLLGPNCMGIFNPHKRLDTLFISYGKLKRPKRGNVAILSQSGAIITCLFETIRLANVGVSKAVGYGNAVDIDESDLYEYLATDKDTDVVISYIESLGDGRKFIDKAKKLSEEKPLLILKPGKGASGQAAAYSHTGRLAGRYEVFHSILKQFGIQEAGDFDEFIDAAKALSYQRPLKGRRVLIVTDGGGSGVLAADECMRQGLDVAKVSDEKTGKLREAFPPFYALNNPVDLTAQVKDADYAFVLNELKDDYDAFIIIALAAVAGVTERLAELIRDFRATTDKPVVVYTANDSSAKKLGALLEKAKIPVYPSPERAVRGLRALLR